VKPTLDDFTLIDKMLLRAQVAFRILFARHNNYAYTIAFRILGVAEEAEEAAQDALIKAIRSLKSFKRKGKFTTWLYRIVFNTAVGRKRKKTEEMVEINDVNELKMERSQNEHSLLKEEKSRYLNLAISRLKEEDNTIITLYYLKELSMEEVSEITDIPVNTLKVKLFRSRKRLAKILKELLKEEVNLML
jgi:RNA polymerase sigma-70 factor (ECF subfamily)